MNSRVGWILKLSDIKAQPRAIVVEYSQPQDLIQIDWLFNQIGRGKDPMLHLRVGFSFADKTTRIRANW